MDDVPHETEEAMKRGTVAPTLKGVFLFKLSMTSALVSALGGVFNVTDAR